MYKLNIILFFIFYFINLISTDIGINFTRQPEPIDAPLYDAIVFDCGLNIPSEHVQWAHNGEIITQNNSLMNGNNNKQDARIHSLTISFDDLSQVGDYQCIAWYGASAIISNPAKLSLADLKPFNKIANENYEIISGNDVILSCPNPESKPAAYIQYIKNGQILTNQNILQSNGLYLKNINKSDEGIYTCMSSNTITDQEYKSKFQFNIEINNNLRSRSPYFIKDPVKKYYIETNNNITIECNALGNPKPKISWYKNNEKLYNNNIDEGTILTILNVNINDSDIYTCKADNGISPIISYDIEIEVQEVPKLIKEPQTGIININENESINFECKFKGYPKPKIDWYLNSKLLINDNNININDGKIYINKVEKKHAGIYQCFGSNILGSTYGITMLQVSPIQKQIFETNNDNDNIFDDIKILNETNHHKHNHENKKHKNKHHGSRNKNLKENIVMIPPTRPNITRLSDKSVMVRWNVPPNNGLPIQFFKVQYKEIVNNKHSSRKNSGWNTANEDISSHIRSYEIDGLETNQTYKFRIAAVYSNNDNKLSPNSAKFHLHKVSNANKNRPKPPSLTETEAISPNIIQIHWQYLNSVFSPVDGFYIYYRAVTTAGDYIKSTVEGQDIRSYNITHLQPNTLYEIKLQSFTIGAASDFSTILERRTLIDPNATIIEITTEITTTNIEIPTNTSSRTYYYVIVGIIITLVTIIGVLYIFINIMKNKPKRNENNDDEDDDDKIESLTIPNINETTTNTTMNGFINHNTHGNINNNHNIHGNSAHGIQQQNGNIPHNKNNSKINGKISNGYINKTIIHSNSNDEDEAGIPPIIGINKDNNISNTHIQTNIGIPIRDNIGIPNELNKHIGNTSVKDEIKHNNIREIKQIHKNTINNNIEKDYEPLNMIEGIHNMIPGTRESINIINNSLDQNNTQYGNIELNYLSNNNNNNNNNKNNNFSSNNNNNNVRFNHNRNNNNKLDNINNKEYELGNNNKMIINNNNNKLSNNNNNWRGRSVVDTRRNDNYM